KLAPLEVKTPAVVDPPRGAAGREVHWVKPSLVAEIAFTEWTNDGTLRHPSFMGLREDKKAADVVRERAAAAPGAVPAGAKSAETKAKTKTKTKTKTSKAKTATPGTPKTKTPKAKTAKTAKTAKAKTTTAKSRSAKPTVAKSTKTIA